MFLYDGVRAVRSVCVLVPIKHIVCVLYIVKLVVHYEKNIKH